MKGLSDMEKGVIERKTEELLRNSGYQTGEVDVISIAKQLGFVVGNAVLSNNIDGFIIVKEGSSEILGINTDKLIGVNAERDLGFKRFTIAHEIAHYILHYDREKDNGMYAHRDHKKGKNTTENDADYFAASLLMPSTSFKKKAQELINKNLEKNEILILLTSYFKVPLESVERRMKEIG